MSTKKFRIAATFVGILSLFPSIASAAEVQTFSNTSPITIPDSGPGSPDPLGLLVSGVGSVTDITVSLYGFTHTSPSDVGALLVGPTGQTVVLMDGAGGFTPVSGLVLSFDDQATTQLPYFTALTSGTYVPGSFYSDTFSSPAPQGPYGSLLNSFDGINANGVWSLYLEDFSPGDSGALTGGYAITVTSVPEPSTYMLFAAGISVLWLSRRRLGKASEGQPLSMA